MKADSCAWFSGKEEKLILINTSYWNLQLQSSKRLIKFIVLNQNNYDVMIHRFVTTKESFKVKQARASHVWHLLVMWGVIQNLEQEIPCLRTHRKTKTRSGTFTYCGNNSIWGKIVGTIVKQRNLSFFEIVFHWFIILTNFPGNSVSENFQQRAWKSKPIFLCQWISKSKIFCCFDTG